MKFLGLPLDLFKLTIEHVDHSFTYKLLRLMNVDCTLMILMRARDKETKKRRRCQHVSIFEYMFRVPMEKIICFHQLSWQDINEKNQARREVRHTARLIKATLNLIKFNQQHTP